MKKIIYITFIVLFSCTNKEAVIDGVIYIKQIDVHNIYGMPDDKIEEFKKIIIDPNQNKYSDSEKKFNKLHKILLDNGVFNVPSFKVKTSLGEIINVYTSKEEYSKLYSLLSSLKVEKEKISITFKGEKIHEGVFNEPLYKSNQIISVEKTSGKTDFKK